MNAKHIFLSLLVFIPFVALAQTHEQLGSSYFAYPTPPAMTPAPQGYTPIYLSHYSRHGSRWITEDSRYEAVLKEFESHELTELGQEVYKRLQMVWEDAKGRSGELTHIGEEQHKAIAQRMVRNFPTLFGEETPIKAQSSTSRRCMMSMMAACEGIKELKPRCEIVRSAYERDMQVINQESDELKSFKKSEWYKNIEDSIYRTYTQHDRLLSSLFVNPRQIAEPIKLFDGLYWIASDMQNVGLPLSFYDLFQENELKNYWKAINYRMYVTNGPSSLNKGITEKSSQNLLQSILDEAHAIEGGTAGKIHLRFGHDSALLRLLTLMQVEECKRVSENDTDADNVANHWHDYELVPMAANLQLVFYRGKTNSDIILRLLLNERDAHLPLKAINGCFYQWKDVKNLWMKQISKQ